MKSMKTLIISAAVCGAMALPMSGVANKQRPIYKAKAVAAVTALLMVQSIVCVKTKNNGDLPRDDKMCTLIGKYINEKVPKDLLDKARDNNSGT
mgnify:CR=1 FL=1